MSTDVQEAGEWIDGFLFLANRTILDFLNTKPVLAGSPTELLTDFQALERWVVSAGLVDAAKTKRLIGGWRRTSEAAAFHADLIAFRERLRAEVLRLEGGLMPSDDFIREVNAGLRKHSPTIELRKREGHFVQEQRFDPHRLEDLWAPLFLGVADLLSEPELHRLRQCEACAVHFFDTSKKGSRRWCSMNICGNKFKVAAYQHRKRDKKTH